MSDFDFDNEHPLFKLAHEGDLDALKEKIERDKSLAKIRAANGATLLMLAAEEGHLPMVQWLLTEGGSNISEANQYGSTALLLAALSGDLETVRWLLSEGGSNISETNRNGNTALLIAAVCGHLETVKWLLTEGGSNISEANQYGYTALLLAAESGHLETVQYLLTHPQMTYRHLKSSCGTTKLKFNDKAVELINTKIEAYEAMSEPNLGSFFKTASPEVVAKLEDTAAQAAPADFSSIEPPTIASHAA